MQEFDSLSAELVRDFGLKDEDLSPELKLCVDRLDELRRRERSAEPEFRLTSHSKNFPIELHIANTQHQAHEIYALRAEAFRESGWIDGDDTAFSDEFDALPTAILIAATSRGRLVGTIRVSVTGADGSVSMPCEQEFPEKLAAIRSEGRGRLAEFCRIAVDPAITNSSFRATLYGSLVRSGMLVACAADVNYAFAAVHARISRFYQHMFGFTRLAKSEAYGIINQPTQLLGLEFQALVRRSSERNGFFHVSPQEIALARRHLTSTHPALIAGH